MSPNKQTIREYLEGFRTGDHARILACLTDDVEWLIPGFFHITGKPAFDGQIENDAFVGRPIITEDRTTEENDVVVVEGRVRCTKKDGGQLHLMFCDVFVMTAGKIRKLTSYLAEIKS